MNSRERVICALSHKEPDKVPLDLGAMLSTGVHAIAYNKLKAYLGIAGETRVHDPWQQIAQVDEEVRRLFQLDVIALDRVRVAFGYSNENWKPYTLPDGSPAMISADFDPMVQPDGSLFLRDADGTPFVELPKGGYWFDMIHFPLANATTVQDIARYNWESLLWPDEDFRLLEEKARRLHEETDYAVFGSFGGLIFENGQMLRGYANFMTDLAGDKKLACAVMDAVLEVHMQNVRRYLEAVASYVQLVQVSDDLGTQDCGWMSVDTYRELLKPRHARLYRYIRDRIDHLFIHSCGSVYKYLPDLIEMGVDVLNPVQTTARDMDPIRLKREFGDRMTFWGGGVDTQQRIFDATPEQIEEHVRERMEIFAPGGGFVFAPEQNFQPDVPPETIVAVYEAAKRFRDYRTIGR